MARFKPYPLLAAVDSDDLARVCKLLANGADPNERSKRPAYTPLPLAALRGHAAICRALLDAGAMRMKRNNREGADELELAARFGHSDVCRELVKDFAYPRRKLSSAAVSAAYAGQPEIIRILITAGAVISKATLAAQSSDARAVLLAVRSQLVSERLDDRLAPASAPPRDIERM